MLSCNFFNGAFQYILWPEWCKEYNEKIPDPGELQKEINTFMEKYDSQEESRVAAEKQLVDPDDEGWVTVTRRFVNWIYIYCLIKIFLLKQGLDLKVSIHTIFMPLIYDRIQWLKVVIFFIQIL